MRSGTFLIYRGAVTTVPMILPAGLSAELGTRDVLRKLDVGILRSLALRRLLARDAMGIVVHDGARWAYHGLVSPPGCDLPDHMPSRPVKAMWWFFFVHTRKAWQRQDLQKAGIALRAAIVPDDAGGARPSTPTPKWRTLPHERLSLGWG